MVLSPQNTCTDAEEKKLMAGCPDLGSKEDIKALFQAHRNGKQLPNIKTLTSLQGKEMRNARSTKASIKNIQLQVCLFRAFKHQEQITFVCEDFRRRSKRA